MDNIDCENDLLIIKFKNKNHLKKNKPNKNNSSDKEFDHTEPNGLEYSIM